MRAALSRRGVVRGATGSSEHTAEAVEAARTEVALALDGTRSGLLKIDQAVYGENGLQPTLATTLFALERMRTGTAPEEASATLRQRLRLGEPCGSPAAVRLPTATLLLTSLSSAFASAQQLHGAIHGESYAEDAVWKALRDSALTIEQRAERALSDFEPLVASAYHAEHLVGLVANACSFWNAGSAQGTLTKGREVKIEVAPRAEVELARLADRPATEFVVLVQPQSFIRPAIAIAAVAAPQARFPTYDTRDVPGGAQIYESGTRDRRFALGGTLGFTWPLLDQRETRGVALWVPEILVTAGDLTGAGIGSAISFGMVKLGAGALWVRHDALRGVGVGDVVADKSGLRVEEGYGKPKLFLSLSVFDWAPFADRIPHE